MMAGIVLSYSQECDLYQVDPPSLSPLSAPRG